MSTHSRRNFLSDVGKGMLVAGIGTSLASDLGISTAFAEEDSNALTFGDLEPLVDLMQQTPVDKLQPLLVKKINSGTSLQTLVSAGALANARSFAGQDYVGFHTMMALMPAWKISQELPQNEKALPILKVLYRNTDRIHSAGGSERMKAVEPAKLANTNNGGPKLLKAMSTGDMAKTEQTFAALSQVDRNSAYNDLQHIVQDAPDVHRVALAWRAWDVMQLTGYEHAQTLLRQSVRYCVQREQERIKRNNPEPVLRKLTPKLLDEYKLLSRKQGTRKADAAWVQELAQTIFSGSRDSAAEATAAALAEGFTPEDVGEAMALAGAMLVLHDPGRSAKQTSAGKPKDSVHGASVGVHASDAANAWRNISRVTNHRNRVCSLIVGAWHTAGQTGQVSSTPFAFDAEAIQAKKLDATALLAELNDAVQSKDQPRAMAVVKAWELAGHAPKPVFDCLRNYAVSEDGALHAEKYFRTVTEEFASARKEYRWNHLIALGRVSASEYGWAAPGREQARGLLRV